MELFTKRRVKLRPVPTQRGLEETELMLGKKKISAKGKIKSNSETRNIKAVDMIRTTKMQRKSVRNPEASVQGRINSEYKPYITLL